MVLDILICAPATISIVDMVATTDASLLSSRIRIFLAETWVITSFVITVSIFNKVLMNLYLLSFQCTLKMPEQKQNLVYTIIPSYN